MHTSNTAILGAGIVVIDTTDPFDAVLAWYRANLKDKMADVVLGPEHHHILTHNGAGVDISVAGAAPDQRTKISLYWNAGGAPPPQDAPGAEAANQPPPTTQTEPANQKEGVNANVAAAAPTDRQPPRDEPPQPDVQPPQAEPLQADAQPVTTEPREANVQPPQDEPLQAEIKAVPTEPLQVETLTLRPVRSDIAMEAAPSPPPIAPAEAEELDRPNARAPVADGRALFKAGRYAEAFLAWQDAAAAGNSNAPLFIGMMYDGGQGVPRNPTEALKWYLIAAKAGSPAGAFNVGVMYDTGDGMARNVAEAADWYARAAAKGSGRAAFNLALLFERGDGIQPDPKRANEYLRRADHLGVAVARVHLQYASADAPPDDQRFGMFRSIGNNTPKSGTAGALTASKSIRQLAEKGSPAAQYDLAYCLETGTGAEIDLHKAYTQYRQAAGEARDPRLKKIAEAGASRVKAHLIASASIASD